jgi:hypothetical protein
MFRTRFEIGPTPLVDGRNFVKRFNDVFAGTVKTTFDGLQPDFLEALRFTPGESKNALNSDQPFRWSNDPIKNANARKWWFVHFPNGRERTGALNEAWNVLLEKVGRAFDILASNLTPYAKWVVGTFDQRRNFQIPGHARTGWRLARETTETFFDQFHAEFLRRFHESIPRVWGGVTARRRNR